MCVVEPLQFGDTWDWNMCPDLARCPLGGILLLFAQAASGYTHTHTHRLTMNCASHGTVLLWSSRLLTPTLEQEVMSSTGSWNTQWVLLITNGQKWPTSSFLPCSHSFISSSPHSFISLPLLPPYSLIHLPYRCHIYFPLPSPTLAPAITSSCTFLPLPHFITPPHTPPTHLPSLMYFPSSSPLPVPHVQSGIRISEEIVDQRRRRCHCDCQQVHQTPPCSRGEEVCSCPELLQWDGHQTSLLLRWGTCQRQCLKRLVSIIVASHGHKPFLFILEGTYSSCSKWPF